MAEAPRQSYKFFPTFTSTANVPEGDVEGGTYDRLASLYSDSDVSGLRDQTTLLDKLEAEVASYNLLPAGSMEDDEGTIPARFLVPEVGVMPFGIRLLDEEEDQSACLKFSLPKFENPFSRFKLPTLPDCGEKRQVIFGLQILGTRAEEDMANPARLDPLVQRQASSQRSVVSTPANPQHISQDIARVAPAVNEDILETYVNSTLKIFVETPLNHVAGWVNSLKSQADAIGSNAAAAMSDSFGSALNGIASDEEYRTWMQGGGGLAVNQLAGVTPLRQVPGGSFDPTRGQVGPLELFGDTASWAGKTYNDAVSTVGNLARGSAIVKDLYALKTGQCLTNDAIDNLINASQLKLQGLNGRCLARMCAAMAIGAIILPLQQRASEISNGFWNFLCSLDGTPPMMSQGVRTAADLNSIFAADAGEASGARPGNLLYAAYGDSPASGDDMLINLPVAAATAMGSPLGQTVTKFLRDSDPSLDALASILPAIFMGGNPEAARLVEVMRVFTEIINYVARLNQGQLNHIEKNVSQVGSPFIDFIFEVRQSLDGLGNLTQLTENLLTQKLVASQRDDLTRLAEVWEGIELDRSVVTDSQMLAHVIYILDRRDNTLATGEKLSDLIRNSGAALNGFGGPAGPETAYALAGTANVMRAGMILNEGEPDAFTRVGDLFATAEEQLGNLSFPGAMLDFTHAVGSAARAGDEEGAAYAGFGPAFQQVQDVAQDNQLSLALSNQQMAEQRGMNAFDLGETANSINHITENADSQSYIAGALNAHAEALRAVLTTSIPSVSGMDKAMADKGFTEANDTRAEAVKALVEEMSNALASTSINKSTGVRLDQQYEGYIKQAKFILMQGGSATSLESPFVRVAGRLVLLQARQLVQEADVIDLRARWKSEYVQDLYAVGTNDLVMMAKRKATVGALKLNLFGLEASILASNKVIEIAIPGKAVMRMTDAGQIEMLADTRIIQRVGSKGIVITGSRVDTNPTVMPSVQVSDVEVTMVAVGDLQTTPEIKPGALMNDGPRNPVPCAAPYLSPQDRVET